MTTTSRRSFLGSASALAVSAAAVAATTANSATAAALTAATVAANDYLWINPTTLHAGWPTNQAPGLNWYDAISLIQTGGGTGGTTNGSGNLGTGKTSGVFAIRASESAPNSMYIGLTSLANQDLLAAKGANTVYAFYGEAYKQASAHVLSIIQGFELDVINRHPSTSQVDPYRCNGDGVVGLSEGQRISTGQLGTQTQYHCSVALSILGQAQSGIGWLRGINFNQDAIAPGGSAISMASGQTIQYFGAANTPTAFIRSDGNSTASRLNLIFANNLIALQDNAGINRFLFDTNGMMSVQATSYPTAGAIQGYMQIQFNGSLRKIALFAA